jgi:hypothetical protein
VEVVLVKMNARLDPWSCASATLSCGLSRRDSYPHVATLSTPTTTQCKNFLPSQLLSENLKASVTSEIANEKLNLTAIYFAVRASLGSEKVKDVVEHRTFLANVQNEAPFFEVLRNAAHDSVSQDDMQALITHKYVHFHCEVDDVMNDFSIAGSYMVMSNIRVSPNYLNMAWQLIKLLSAIEDA